MQARTPWQVTCNVWHAMFMREAVARTTGDRFAAFWMLAEPVLMVALMIGVRLLLGRVKFILGAEFIPWLIVGLLTFYLFREGMMRSMGAINANSSLFTYRQVKPIDTVIVRCALEGLLKSIVFIILFIGCLLLGFDIIPHDPLGAIFVWFSVWLLGLGTGLIISVAATLIPELEKIFRMISLPLMLLSGALLPVVAMSHQLKGLVLYNPVLHGIESMRIYFFEGYHTISGISMLYLYYWALGCTVLGLLLHIKFRARLKAQ